MCHNDSMAARIRMSQHCIEKTAQQKATFEAVRRWSSQLYLHFWPATSSRRMTTEPRLGKLAAVTEPGATTYTNAGDTLNACSFSTKSVMLTNRKLVSDCRGSAKCDRHKLTKRQQRVIC